MGLAETIALTDAKPPAETQLRHRCAGGHRRLIAKVVERKLEFVCDSCHERYYWNEEFLLMLVHALRAGQDFQFEFK